MGLPLDQNVYDGALWSSIAPLSEWSVANRSQSIDVPDFTGGSWKTNKPHDINLEDRRNNQSSGSVSVSLKDGNVRLNVIVIRSY